MNPDGTYTLTFADTGQWNFLAFDGSPAQGKISSIVDRNGNTMTFTYDVLGRLQIIWDTLSRPINVAYTAFAPDAHIAGISDWGGRSILYAYYADGEPDGSAGDLKSVTSIPLTTGACEAGPPNRCNDFLAGKTTEYTYTTGFADEELNHDLVSIKDPKGQVYLTNVYAHTIAPGDPRYTTDPANINYDRVVRQFWGHQPTVTRTGTTDADTIDLVYVAQIPTPDNNFAKVKVIINDRVGNVKMSIFDRGNRAIQLREYTGRWDPDQPTFEADLGDPPIEKLRSTDPAYFVMTWEYNDDSLPTQIVHPQGNSELSVYDSDNDNPASRGNRHVHCRLPGPRAGDQTQICEHYTYEPGMGGCCGTNFVRTHRDGRGNTATYTRDARGNVIQIDHRIPGIVENFTFNDFGQMTSHTLPDNGSGHRRTDKYVYYAPEDGDQEGYMCKEIVDADPGTEYDCAPAEPRGGPASSFELTRRYAYNLFGIVTAITDAKGNTTDFSINRRDQVIAEYSRTFTDLIGMERRYVKYIFYDANDNLVRTDFLRINEAGSGEEDTNLQPYLTEIREFEILNNEFRMCQEVGIFTGTVPPANDVSGPTCVGLPDADFVTTENEFDANRNRTLMRSPLAVGGVQPDNRVFTEYDERDLVFRVTRGYGDAGQSTTQYDFDENRNQVAVHEGVAGPVRTAVQTSTFFFDGYNRLRVSDDTMGNRHVRHYDPNGNLAAERIVGEVIDVTNAMGDILLWQATYEYDEMDRRTQTQTVCLT
jgi:YD repeat-containing protein